MKKLVLSIALMLSAGNLFGAASKSPLFGPSGTIATSQVAIPTPPGINLGGIDVTREKRIQEQKAAQSMQLWNSYQGNTALMQKDQARYNQLNAKPITTRTVAEQKEMDALSEKLGVLQQQQQIVG